MPESQVSSLKSQEKKVFRKEGSRNGTVIYFRPSKGGCVLGGIRIGNVLLKCGGVGVFISRQRRK